MCDFYPMTLRIYYDLELRNNSKNAVPLIFWFFFSARRNCVSTRKTTINLTITINIVSCNGYHICCIIQTWTLNLVTTQVPWLALLVYELKKRISSIMIFISIDQHIIKYDCHSFIWTSLYDYYIVMLYLERLSLI